MSPLAELVKGLSRLLGAGPSRGGRLPWASHPDMLGGPARGARLVLGSILPAAQPCADAAQLSSDCSLLPLLPCVHLHTASPGSHGAGGTLWDLSPQLPCPCGDSGLGLVPRDRFGANWDCSGSGCRGIQPLHPQSSPIAWLGAAGCTCAPAWGGGTSLRHCSARPHCVFQCCQHSLCPGVLSRPHVSMPRGSRQLLLPVASLSQALIPVFLPTDDGSGSSGWEGIPPRCRGCGHPSPTAVPAALLWAGLATSWLCP